MFNIYDMMKSGMSADEIAAMFTQNLNDAEAKIKAEEAEAARLAEEAARAEQERVDKVAEKRAAFAAVAEDLMRVMAAYYPDLMEGVPEGSADAIADLIIMTLDLETLRASRPRVRVQIKNAEDGKATTVKEVDPFATFFKQFGLS